MKTFKYMGLAAIVLFILALTGCEKRPSPKEYLQSEIKKVKTGKSDIYEKILEEELELEDGQAFPEELKEGYLVFLKEAYSHMKYEITEVEDKGKNQYRVIVSVEPLDLKATVQDITQEYLANMQSANLTTETKEVLALNQEELERSKYTDKLEIPVRMDWEQKKYTINEFDFSALVSAAVANKLAPYQMVEEVFDIQKYVEACLDADFKGEFDEYTRQTGLTKEEAEAQRNEGLWDSELESQLNFTEEEKGRFTEALKGFLASVSYEVGIPRKVEDNHYTVEITYTPNLSLKKCMDEAMAAVTSGAITSMDALKQEYLTSMESYVNAGEYGEQAAATVNVVPGDDNRLQIAEEDLENLYSAILPVE